MVQRFFLGLAEGGAYPCILRVLGMWYLKREQALRAPLINCAPGAFGIFFGLSNYGVVRIGPAAHAWKNVFYFIGPITCACALVLFWAMPDSPVASAWLSDREKYVVGV